METQILKQEKNPFLHREEILMEIQSEATPSFAEVKKELGKNQELTVIKKIISNFGTKTFHADVVVYENAESKKKVETLHKNQKKKQEAPASPTSQPEQKTEATPIEDSQTKAKPEISSPEANQDVSEEKPTEEIKEEVKEEKQEDGN